MKDASQYSITFGYGATDGYYYGPNGTVGPYHRGDDRAMPSGTPVIVNGVQIGLSGTTGASSGPHLHIGRWVGGKDTNPQGGGFTLEGATVTETNYDNTNGNYVRVRDASGASWVYLHLSKITTSAGTKLQGGDMPTIADETDVNIIYGAMLGRSPDPGGKSTYIGKDLRFVLRDINNSQEHSIYWNNLQSAQQRINELSVALANEQNKPPREVVKEVTKIVEKPVEVKVIEKVEVPVETIVYTHDNDMKITLDKILSVVLSIKGLVLNLFKKGTK